MGTRRARVLSVRTCDEILAHLEKFRKAQLAMPSQTAALRALVKLGFERWSEQSKRASEAG